MAVILWLNFYEFIYLDLSCDGCWLQDAFTIIAKRKPPVETGGCKPKPTAYEKIFEFFKYIFLVDRNFSNRYFDFFLFRKV